MRGGAGEKTRRRKRVGHGDRFRGSMAALWSIGIDPNRGELTSRWPKEINGSCFGCWSSVGREGGGRKGDKRTDSAASSVEGDLTRI